MIPNPGPSLDFGLGETAEAIRDTTQRFAADRIAPLAADIDAVLPALSTRQRTYLITRLNDQHMIRPVREGARSYTINFTNNYLLRSVIHALEKEGFIQPFVKAAPF